MRENVKCESVTIPIIDLERPLLTLLGYNMSMTTVKMIIVIGVLRGITVSGRCGTVSRRGTS